MKKSSFIYVISMASCLMLFSTYIFGQQPAALPGVLGQVQAGTLGDISSGATWTTLGPLPYPVNTVNPLNGVIRTGLRLNDRGQFGMFYLAEDGAAENVNIAFGQDSVNQVNFKFIQNQTAAGGTNNSDILTITHSGVGVLTDPNESAALDVLGQYPSHISNPNSPDPYRKNFGIRSRGGDIGIFCDAMRIGGYFNVQNPNYAANGYTAGTAYGVYSLANNAAQTNIAVRARAINGTVENRAVYATAPGAADWAGYFQGRSFTTADEWTPSDADLKTEIEDIRNSLEKIMELKPKGYKFIQEGNESFGFERGPQVGFLSQDVEKILPNFVTEVNLIDDDAETGEIKSSRKIKALSYTKFIPLLTAAIQEQQAQIEELTNRVDELENGNVPVKNRTGLQPNNGTNPNEVKPRVLDQATLFQNSPNPFSQQTTIKYQLPPTYEQATIYIFNMNGQKVQAYHNLTGDVLTIEGGFLSAGMYYYNLVIDGQEIDMKRMVLTD
ncbi:MAG: tail fiber domain-containing protein [Bacteroidota bacterium]